MYAVKKKSPLLMEANKEANKILVTMEANNEANKKGSREANKSRDPPPSGCAR